MADEPRPPGGQHGWAVMGSPADTAVIIDKITSVLFRILADEPLHYIVSLVRTI
jgi:hypothetical protein